MSSCRAAGSGDSEAGVRLSGRPIRAHPEPRLQAKCELSASHTKRARGPGLAVSGPEALGNHRADTTRIADGERPELEREERALDLERVGAGVEWRRSRVTCEQDAVVLAVADLRLPERDAS